MADLLCGECGCDVLDHQFDFSCTKCGDCDGWRPAPESFGVGDAMTTEYGHRWGTGDITNHGTDREQAEQMVRRARAYNHGPGVKLASTHALMVRQVTGWREVEEADDERPDPAP